MAKRNKKLNYEQKIKEGRGSGSGKDQYPLLLIDFRELDGTVISKARTLKYKKDLLYHRS